MRLRTARSRTRWPRSPRVLPGHCTNAFVENFGSGPNAPALSAGQTTYTYVASGVVQDGNYAIMSQHRHAAGGWWLAGADHTPGDTNGRMMLINAAFAAGKFFSKTFTGSTPAARTTSPPGSPTPTTRPRSCPTSRSSVVDPATGAVLATVDTGDIAEPGQPDLEPVQPVVRRHPVHGPARARQQRTRRRRQRPCDRRHRASAAVCEHGDAPDSYGTLLASNGPVHAKGAPHLGATVDYEGDGQPTAAADGDDTTGTTDDEDGVTFNPALGYPNPTIRTGPDPITLDPVVNHMTVNASAAGFASAWVDWNEDGDFADAGEQVADAQAGDGGQQRPDLQPAAPTRTTSAPTCGCATAPMPRRSTPRPALRRTARSRTTRCWSSVW